MCTSRNQHQRIRLLTVACFLCLCQINGSRVRTVKDQYSAENLRKIMDTVPVEIPFPLTGKGMLTYESEPENSSDGGFDVHFSIHINPTGNTTHDVDMTPSGPSSATSDATHDVDMAPSGPSSATSDATHDVDMAPSSPSSAKNVSSVECQEGNFDPATHCTTCLAGFDPSTRCTYCLSGLDLDTNCQSVAIGFEHSSCSLQAGCGRCRAGFDPMVSCKRCLQGRDMSTDCQSCLPSFVMQNGQCVRSRTRYNMGNPWTVHIVGDTHGDSNYLARSLLSTGRFVLTKEYPGIAWADSVDNTFEIIILGDLTDRGYRSLGNLMMVRALASQDTHGRLKIVLGNHESLTLQHDFVTKKHNGHEWHHGDWTEEEIKAAHAGIHKSAETLHWLRLQPVVYMTWGILMMHGGLSLAALSFAVTDLMKAKGTQCMPGVECGREVVNHLNDLALHYFAKVKAFMMENGPQHHPWTQEAVNDNDGVLWYRGYSATYAGADSPQECAKATTVAQFMGVMAMAVAHTTHPRITRYCRQPGQTPVFATDTHFEDCVKTDECDFSPDHEFHKDGKIDLNKPMVPQSLYIKFSAQQIATRRCMSMISSGRASVHCDQV